MSKAAVAFLSIAATLAIVFVVVLVSLVTLLPGPSGAALIVAGEELGARAYRTNMTEAVSSSPALGRLLARIQVVRPDEVRSTEIAPQVPNASDVDQSDRIPATVIPRAARIVATQVPAVIVRGTCTVGEQVYELNPYGTGIEVDKGLAALKKSGGSCRVDFGQSIKFTLNASSGTVSLDGQIVKAGDNGLEFEGQVLDISYGVDSSAGFKVFYGWGIEQ